MVGIVIDFNDLVASKIDDAATGSCRQSIAMHDCDYWLLVTDIELQLQRLFGVLRSTKINERQCEKLCQFCVFSYFSSGNLRFTFRSMFEVYHSVSTIHPFSSGEFSTAASCVSRSIVNGWV